MKAYSGKKVLGVKESFHSSAEVVHTMETMNIQTPVRITPLILQGFLHIPNQEQNNSPWA